MGPKSKTTLAPTLLSHRPIVRCNIRQNAHAPCLRPEEVQARCLDWIGLLWRGRITKLTQADSCPCKLRYRALALLPKTGYRSWGYWQLPVSHPIRKGERTQSRQTQKLPQHSRFVNRRKVKNSGMSSLLDVEGICWCALSSSVKVGRPHLSNVIWQHRAKLHTRYKI